MNRVKFGTFFLGSLAVLYGCAGNPYGPKGDFQAVDPFKPLPASVVAYEGRGLARDSDLHIALRKAETMALGDLARSIYRVVATETSVYVNDPEKQKLLLDDVSTVATVLPLPGTLFKECMQNSSTGEVFCRVYVAKSEADEQIFTQLSAMSRSLLKDTEEQLRARIQKSASRADRDVKLLKRFRETGKES